MQADLSEQRLLSATVRRFIREKLTAHEGPIDVADEVDLQLIRSLKAEVVKLGLYGYNLPEALGGPGLSVRSQCAIDEELGRTSMPLAEVFGHLPGSLRFVADHQYDWLMAPLRQAEKSIAYALTEPSAGSDLSSIHTRASRTAGGWVLEGGKHFITGAEHADFLIVLAVTDSQAPLSERFSTFIVERRFPGFSIPRQFRAMGWHGHRLSELVFENCFVPDTHVLGKIGEGFRVIMSTINSDRLMVACRCVGIAQQLYDMVLPHVRERHTFGKPLAEHQVIQFMIADSDVEIDAARLLNHKAAALADEGSSEYRVAASRAKLFASEMAGRVADRVLQIFGGAGYTSDLPVERFYRDVRAFRIGEGSSEMQRLQIARHVLSRS